MERFNIRSPSKQIDCPKDGGGLKADPCDWLISCMSPSGKSVGLL